MSNDKLREAVSHLVREFALDLSLRLRPVPTLTDNAVNDILAALADSGTADASDEIDLMKVLVKNLKDREAADAPPEPTKETP